MVGIVKHQNQNHLWVIECPDAPSYLRMHYVRPAEVAPELRKELRAGMKVRLVYATNGPLSTWHVTEEIKP